MMVGFFRKRHFLNPFDSETGFTRLRFGQSLIPPLCLDPICLELILLKIFLWHHLIIKRKDTQFKWDQHTFVVSESYVLHLSRSFVRVWAMMSFSGCYIGFNLPMRRHICCRVLRQKAIDCFLNQKVVHIKSGLQSDGTLVTMVSAPMWAPMWDPEWDPEWDPMYMCELIGELVWFLSPLPPFYICGCPRDTPYYHHKNGAWILCLSIFNIWIVELTEPLARSGQSLIL